LVITHKSIETKLAFAVNLIYKKTNKLPKHAQITIVLHTRIYVIVLQIGICNHVTSKINLCEAKQHIAQHDVQ